MWGKETGLLHHQPNPQQHQGQGEKDVEGKVSVFEGEYPDRRNVVMAPSASMGIPFLL
jgi:hypothetical protein